MLAKLPEYNCSAPADLGAGLVLVDTTLPDGLQLRRSAVLEMPSSPGASDTTASGLGTNSGPGGVGPEYGSSREKFSAETHHM